MVNLHELIASIEAPEGRHYEESKPFRVTVYGKSRRAVLNRWYDGRITIEGPGPGGKPIIGGTRYKLPDQMLELKCKLAELNARPLENP